MVDEPSAPVRRVLNDFSWLRRCTPGVFAARAGTTLGQAILPSTNFILDIHIHHSHYVAPKLATKPYCQSRV